jgi:hypothetical protein
MIAVDSRRLSAIATRRKKHVWRAKIILPTADGCGTAEIMRRSARRSRWCGAGRPGSWPKGVAGLTRDKTRKPDKLTLPTITGQRMVDLALGPLPGEASHWTARIWRKR